MKGEATVEISRKQSLLPFAKIWYFRISLVWCTLACGHFLSPLLSHAQSATASLRELSSFHEREALPIIDREGACLAWWTAVEVFGANAQGQRGAAIAGKVLKTSVSGNSSTFALLEKVEEKQQSALRLLWFGRRHELRGSHTMSWHVDDPLPQFCFNTAASRLLIADAATAQIKILSADGQVLREATVFDNAPYVNERPLFLAASAENFFVMTQDLPTTPQRPARPLLICFSADGRELWRQELAYGTAGGLAVSDAGDEILAGSYEATSDQARVSSAVQFFDHAGKSQFRQEGLLRQALFSQNAGRVLILDRRQARVLRLPEGSELWQSSLASRADMFVTAAADANLENVFALIATSTFKNNRFVFEKARLVKIDSTGRWQQAAMLDAELIEPALAMRRDSTQLVLAAEGMLRCYSFSSANKAAK